MENKKKQIRFLYDETAGHYDERYLPIQFKKYEQFKDIINPAPKVLDYGGGSGLFARHIYSPVDVLDLSMNLLRTGIKKTRSCNWVAGDGEKAPFRVGSYSLIISFTAIQNFPDMHQGIKEMSRLLGNNGFVIVTALAKKVSKEVLIDIAQQSGFNCEPIDLPIEDIGMVCRKDGTTSLKQNH